MTLRPRSLLACVLTLALILGQIPAVFAAPAASSRISGRVFETDLITPAADLLVQAYPEGQPAPLAAGRTDEKGRFLLKGLPAGSFVVLLVTEQGQALAATRVQMNNDEHRKLLLALPQESAEKPPESAEKPPEVGEKPPEGAEAATPAKKGGILSWMSTPVGATVTIVAAALVLSVAADELTSSSPPPPPVTPTSPQ